MNRNWALAIFLTMFGASAAIGQQTATDMRPFPSRYDVAAGYNFIRANAPPADCGCFSMNGAFVAGDVNLNDWFSVAGEVTGGHATKISALGQNLTLTTFMAGPRVSWVHDRYTPFVEFLVGGAHGSGSYFPSGASSTTSSSTLTYAAGGGVDINLTPRFAIRAVNAKYLHTAFPNDVNSSQNQLEISSGIVFRFGAVGPKRHHAPPPPPEPKTEISLSCRVTDPDVLAGHSVQVIGDSTVTPDQGEVSYTWTTSGGVVQGEGRMVTIDTTKLAPGTYRVEGRASLTSNPSLGSGCGVSFSVKQEDAQQDQTMPTKVAASPVGSYDDDPREHLHDAFFSYDKSDLRIDAQEVVAKDAAFLTSRPEINITIAGYADERGSAEYNIALGLQRAITTKEALVAAGVAESRIEVLSYGKEKPFCTEDGEDCYQQNRRAQFVLNGKQ